ncbi:MAG: glycosyltransferase family 4 protein [Planctomycetota bacterium]
MRLLMVSGDRLLAAGKRGPFWHLQKEFSRHFERIDVLHPRPVGPVVETEFFDGRLHLHPADCGRAGMLAYLKRRGAELIAEQRPVLIVSHDYGWFYNGLASAWLSGRTGVPYLSEIHHVPGVPVAADARERLDRFVARRYVAWAKSRARAFRVVNHGEMPALLRGWGVPDEKICVLGSLYMDLATFSPPENAVEPEQELVFVGRMVNNKGLDRIVEAVAQLRAEGRPHRALLVGSGPFQERTAARVRELGLGDAVRFVEWVGDAADLAEVYRKSRVVVCASTCEGGPRFTVEAMACGTPCVSTRVGVMGELLEDGAAGRLVDFTAGGLAAGLTEVLGDEERRLAMGRAARAIAERFEYADMIRGYADGLKRLVGEEERRSA